MSTNSHMIRSSRKAASPSAILEIDPRTSVAWVEPGVTIEQLVLATAPYHLMPAVVPEFKKITVGGAIMGAALESSSFRYGQFNDTCLEYEVLLSDGTSMWVSPTQYPELFYGLSGSYGTIARLKSVKLQLVPAKKYVHLSYTVIPDFKDVGSALSVDPRSDFLEAIALEDGLAAIISGHLSDEKQALTNLSRLDAPWFYQHLKRCVDNGIRTDCLTLYDYVFRTDRAAFWMGQYVSRGRSLLHFVTEGGLTKPNLSSILREQYRKYPPTLDPSWLRRVLLNGKLSSASLYRILHALPEQTFAHTYMVQDFYIPVHQLKNFLAYLQDNIGVLPLWFCPIQNTLTPQILSPHYGQTKFINVGVYGVPKKAQNIPAATHDLEVLVHQLGGRKMLYSWCYYSEELFWKIYPRPEYQQLRDTAKTPATVPTLYERVH